MTIDEKYAHEACLWFEAYHFLTTLDRTKYGELIKGLVGQYSLDNDQWPKDLEAAHRAAHNHVWDPAYKDRRAKERESP